jgi:histidinol-phosphate aminotransferase
MGVIEEIVAERERLAKEMERVPDVRVFPSSANFLLFRTSWDGRVLWNALAERGVLVRDFSTLVPDCLRVTVGTADQNATFVETLRRTLAAQE